MKKLIIFAAMLTALPLNVLAQDDMYFGSSKSTAGKSKVTYGVPADTYYSGSTRSVDEYNRRGGSYYEPVAGDSTMRDVIYFSEEQGVYPDSTGDFSLTRKMSRWEGYTPTDAYWEGYDRGRSDEWSASTWHSPWYYSSFYPWYDSYWYWNDPWYYRSSWYYSWYDPWYYRPYYHYGWGGYYYPYHRPYYRGGGYYTGRGSRNSIGAGTIDRYGRTHGSAIGRRGGSTLSGNVRNRTASTLGNGTYRSSSSNRSFGSSNVRNRTGATTGSSYGGSRSSSMGSSSSRSSSFGGSSGGSRGGSSFGGGGSRSGGSFSGGGGGSSRRR